MAGEIFSMVLALIGTGCVIYITYHGSRWYAKKMGAVTGGRHIKVIERIPLGKASSLVLLELQGKQYMMGVSDQNLQILKELDEKLESVSGEGTETPDFQRILTSLNKWKGSK